MLQVYNLKLLFLLYQTIDQSVNQFMIARRAKETGKEENQKITWRKTVLFL